MSDLTASKPFAGINGAGAHETRSCPGCNARMRLVGVEPPHAPDIKGDIYTYECVVCGDVCAETVHRL